MSHAKPALSPPIIALVVAMAENSAIGRGGDLPWRLSSDLRYFRKVTMGKPVIMGRRTFKSLPRVLDGRLNIVLTRDLGFVAPDAVMDDAETPEMIGAVVSAFASPATSAAPRARA